MQKLISINIFFLFFNFYSYSQEQYETFFKLCYYNAFHNEDSSLLYSNKLIAIDKSYSTAYFIISQNYFKQNNFILALKNIDFALNIDKQNLYYNILKFKILVKLNDYSQAKSIADKILSTTYLEAVHLDIINDLSFFSDIENYFKIYTSLFPFNNSFFDVYMNSLNHHFEQNNFLNFVLYTQKYTNINFPKIKNFCTISNNHNLQLLLKNYILSTFKNTKNKEFLLLLSNIYLTENKYDSSFYFFSSYFKVNYSETQSIIHYLNINKQLILSPNNPFLDSLINTVSENNLNNEYSEVLSQYYFETNNLYKSMDLYKKTLDYSNIENCINYLNLLYRFDNFNEIDSISSDLVILYPFDPYINLFKSISSIFLEKYEDANSSLNKLYRLSFNDTIVLSYYYFYSYILKFKTNEQNSNEILLKALKLSSSNHSLQINFAFYLVKYLNQTNQALSIIKNQNSNNNPSSLYIFAYIYYKNKEYQKSMEYITEAINNSQFNNFIYYELKANVLKKLNLTEESEHFFYLSQKYGNININRNL